MHDALSSTSFRAVCELFHRASGIRLTEAKRALVAGRLRKLSQEAGAPDMDAYVEALCHGDDPDEVVRAVDRLTTNETFFFREPEHFELLGAELASRAAAPLSVWSAACSSGEEAYSLAMTLATHATTARWDVLGTDLSTAMVEAGRAALYPMERAQGLPPAMLRRWCLKGEGAYAGRLLIARELRRQVRFDCVNLMRPLPEGLGPFDVIFLRNVLIYFEPAAKADIARRVLGRLKPDGLLFTGHAESLSNLGLPVRAVAPAVYAHA